jgi:CRP-like cAMP-binding protein
MGRVGRRVRVEASETLIREGEPLACVYILLEGSMLVSVAGDEGAATRGVGEVFGELSFVDAMPPSATVRALTRATLLALDKRELERRIAEDPVFGCRFYRALAMFLSDRLRATRLPAPGQGLSLADEQALDGELDGNVLETVSQAGARFDRLLKTLAAEAE